MAKKYVMEYKIEFETDEPVPEIAISSQNIEDLEPALDMVDSLPTENTKVSFARMRVAQLVEAKA